MGVIIRNGINYSNESFVEVTQAQYDALSEEERMNGTVYLISGIKSIVRKEKIYSSSSAEQISYGDGTVKDALDSSAKLTTKTFSVSPTGGGRAFVSIGDDRTIVCMNCEQSNVVGIPYSKGTNGWWCQFLTCASGTAITAFTSAVSGTVYLI